MFRCSIYPCSVPIYFFCLARFVSRLREGLPVPTFVLYAHDVRLAFPGIYVSWVGSNRLADRLLMVCHDTHFPQPSTIVLSRTESITPPGLARLWFHVNRTIARIVSGNGIATLHTISQICSLHCHDHFISLPWLHLRK
jgi:hypothetical protein